MKIAAIITVLVALTVSDRCVAGDMSTNIEQQVGIVARQLLEYAWRPDVAGDGTHTVQTNLLTEFKFWVAATVAMPFAPPESAEVSIHQGTPGTCDAIRLVYQKDGLTITTIQTRLSILVVVEGPETACSDFKDSAAVANRVAQRILGWPESCPLVVTHTSAELAAGQPHYSEKKEGFLMDRWWSDGKKIAFWGVKVPFKNKAMVVVVSSMKGLERNQRWFNVKDGRMDR